MKRKYERMLKLERLYVLDGRHHPSHQKHGKYEGLEERAEELESELVEQVRL